jgi:hypothetical protein
MQFHDPSSSGAPISQVRAFAMLYLPVVGNKNYVVIVPNSTVSNPTFVKLSTNYKLKLIPDIQT